VSTQRAPSGRGWSAARYAPPLVLLLLGAATTAGLWLRGRSERAAGGRPAIAAPVAPSATLPPSWRHAQGSAIAGKVRASGVLNLSPRDLEQRGLLIPVDGIGAADLRDSFDAGRRGHMHEAIDILAPRNTPVRAVEDGVIAKLFSSGPGGTAIYQFDPAGEYCYYYAHLERYADDLANGQAVRRGQIVGYVGTSGNAPKNTPHLHFAIYRLNGNQHWWEGEALDPFPVLRAGAAQGR